MSTIDPTSPDNNTVNISVSAHGSMAITSFGVLSLILNTNTDTLFMAPTAVVRTGGINLMTIAPTKVSVFFKSTTAAIGRYAVVLHDSSLTSFGGVLSATNIQAAIRPADVSSGRLYNFDEGYDDVAYDIKPTGIHTNYSAKHGATQSNMMSTLKWGGTTYQTSSYEGAVFTKDTSSVTSWSRTKESATAMGSQKNYIELGGGVYSALKPDKVASPAAYYSDVYELELPNRYDLAASATYGWLGLRISVVVRTIDNDSVTVHAVLNPKAISEPSVCRRWGRSHIHATTDYHKVINVQPVSVTWEAGSTPVQVATTLPLPVTVANTVNTRITSQASALTTVLDTTNPVAVCGAIGSYPRVPITTERKTLVAAEGSIVPTEVVYDKPLTISNRPGVKESIPWDFIAKPGGVVPLVVAGSIVGQPPVGEFVSPYDTTDPGAIEPVKVAIQSAGVLGVKIAEPSSVSITGTAQVAGQVTVSGPVKVTAADEQLRPLWIAETDPDTNGA